MPPMVGSSGIEAKPSAPGIDDIEDPCPSPSVVLKLPFLALRPLRGDGVRGFFPLGDLALPFFLDPETGRLLASRVPTTLLDGRTPLVGLLESSDTSDSAEGAGFSS